MRITKPTGFVIYGAMRTGSNFLVSLLNQFPDVVCHGEAFNPAFVGLREDYYERLEMARDETAKREADIDGFYDQLLDRANISTLCGFKLFPDHHEPTLKRTLADDSLLKIILKRDLLTSFISLCQAEESGIWMIKDNDKKLRDQQRARSDQPIYFDGPRFLQYRRKVATFYQSIDRSLQLSNSHAITLWYRQLYSTSELLAQLALFLGRPVPQVKSDQLLAKQNLTKLHERILNLQEMVDFLDANGYSSGSVETARHHCLQLRQSVDLK